MENLKARELRIGNIISRKGWLPTDNKFYETIVSHNDITACFISPETFKPIPLTEDIILKCGFSNAKQINKRYFKHDKISGGIYLGANYANYKYTNIIIDIVSLHQLQNLYFVLTNEELTILSNESL